jgi:hypothetical protein
MKATTHLQRGVKVLFWQARRKLHITPMYQVMRGIESRGVSLHKLTALELFGHTGKMHTVDYAPFVKSLEVWEIDPDCELALHENLPDARIRIVDSCKQLLVSEGTFDLIVVDSWTRMFGGHIEHFELFPDIFRVMNEFTILILNIMPEIYTNTFLEKDHYQRRRTFYHVDNPSLVPPKSMIKSYKALSQQNGYDIAWWFVKDRYFMHSLRPQSLEKRLCYLVLAFKKLAAT